MESNFPVGTDMRNALIIEMNRIYVSTQSIMRGGDLIKKG